MPKGKSIRDAAPEILRLRSAVLCDEVRKEDNGKLLLIGTYTDGVIASQKPALLMLHLLVLLEVNSDGEHLIEYRLNTPGAQGGGSISTGKDAVAGACLAAGLPVPCFAEDEGKITVQWRVDNGEWCEPISWNVKFAPNAAPQSPEVVAELKGQFKAITDAAIAQTNRR